MTAIDYEVEYNNRARVPENPALMAGWARDAAAYREQRAPRRIAYGPGARHIIDVFADEREGKAPLVIFIHGGYWQALDGSWFSHMARGLNAHGIGVAVPTYDLCPQVSVADIIMQMREAMRELARAFRAACGQRPFRRRASCRLHAGDRLAGLRRVLAAANW